MTSRSVYVNGPDQLWRKPQPDHIFVGHEYFGDDVQRRSDYRLPFNDAFSSCGYQPLFPDQAARPGGLLSKLTEEMLNAGASIFDVTGCNANVLIELGVALGMNVPVLTICEADDSTLPGFLASLTPLRYPSRAILKKTVVAALKERISTYTDGRLNPRYCVACQQECMSRRNGPWSAEDYLVVGVSEETDEDLSWNVEETLKNFQPPAHEEFPLESQQVICQWIERLQRAKIALFSLRAPHHGPETAAVYLQLGLAAGLGVPWTMILREKEAPPVDLRGLVYVPRGESDVLFRNLLSNAIRGLLLENRVVVPNDGPPLPYPELADEEEEESDPLGESADVQSLEYDPDTQQRYEIVDEEWSTYNEQIRRVLSVAQDEALRLNHNYIGTEHLLLGLGREGDGMAAKVLANLSVDLNKVRSAIEFIIERGDRIVLGEFAPTARAKKVIELAVDEARRLNHHYIGSEHLLLGLVREGEGIAAGVLEAVGVNLEKTRRMTTAVLTGEQLPPSEQYADRGSPPIRDKFEKFTERARKVLSLSQDEAQRFNHNYIGTEHLLLALTRLGEGTAIQVLANLGVEPSKTRSTVEFIIERGDRIVLGEIGLTPRAKKVIELAVDEARRLNHHYVGTEHLLLGMIREGDGIAAGVLESLGVNLEKARRETIAVLSGEQRTNQGSPSNLDKFDKFTERARKVLSLAQDEAQRFNHNYIGTEHLLLGLVREGDGVAAKVLANLGVELNKVRTIVEFIIGRGDRIVLGEIGLTPRSKKVIELAVDEARRLNHHYVGTEHLLLGLVREGEGIAAGVLESLGVNLEKVRSQTIQVLSQSGNQHEGGREKHSKTPTIDQMGIDLTAHARMGKLDPVVGREQEIERVIQILSRRQKNNPALIGEPGVGKTAIVEGLAQRIVSGEVPETLMGKRLLTLDVGSLVAGTKYRGEFEERLKKIIEEIRSSQDCIIFIDEVHTLVGAGAAEGAVDAANILKPALSRGELQCIGATTLDEYRKYIEKDAALQRRFQEVMVREPSVEETLDILKGLRDRYESHHRLTISDDALRAAAEMGSRYITDRFLPDKAIDLIDEASSRVRMQRSLAPLNLKEAMRGLEAVLREKDEAIQNQQYEQAQALLEREKKLRERITKLESGWHKDQSSEKPVVTEEDIAQIVSMWTGIPVMRIAQEESARLLEMEGALHKRVIGQDEAIETISRAVRRARAGLKDPKRPIGSFIFMGPTGVGKTELAKALAEFMFGSEDALIKIDMSEFMERHSAARLVGAPPGYVGYEEGGQLTEAVRRKSYSVILLDEIEKAHPDVFNMLLQILEDGKLTDAKGRTVDFRNTIIIMTSNVGATLLNREAAIGFMQTRDKDKAAQNEYDRMKDKVLGELKNTFKPEFLNRIDAIIVFHSLRQEHVRQIVDLLLGRVRVQLTEQQIELVVPDDAKDFLVTKGYDPQYGARPLRRTIQNLIEDPLAEFLLQGKFQAGDVVHAIARDGTIVLEQGEHPDGLRLPPPPEAALSAGGSEPGGADPLR